jgi:hypothetical protein
VSDGHRNLTNDAHVQQLQPGQRVLVRAAQEQEGAVFQVCCAAVTYLVLRPKLHPQTSPAQQQLFLTHHQQAGMAADTNSQQC